MPGEPLTQGPPGFVVRRRWSPRRDAEAAKTIFRGASHGSCVNCERCNGFDTLSAVVVSPSQLQHGRSGHVDNGVGKIHFAASSLGETQLQHPAQSPCVIPHTFKFTAQRGAYSVHSGATRAWLWRRWQLLE